MQVVPYNGRKMVVVSSSLLCELQLW